MATYAVGTAGGSSVTVEEIPGEGAGAQQPGLGDVNVKEEGKRRRNTVYPTEGWWNLGMPGSHTHNTHTNKHTHALTHTHTYTHTYTHHHETQQVVRGRYSLVPRRTKLV